MKETPGRPRLKEMQRLKERLTYLSSLANTEALLVNIPAARIIHFAQEARSLENHHLLQMRPNHAYTLLLCLLHYAKMQTRDHLAELFVNRMQRIHQAAKDDLDAFNEQARLTREMLIELFAEVALKTQRTADDAQLGAALRDLLEAHGGAEYLYQQARALAIYHDDNTLPFLWKHYAKHRKAIWNLLALLDLRATSEDLVLMEALDFLKQNLAAERLPLELSLSFASQRWQRFVLERDEQGQSWFNRRAFELCVLSHLAQDLKSGDIAVVGSEEHADYREQLLSWEEALPMLDEHCASIGIPNSAEGLFRLLYETMKETAQRVDQRFPEDGQLTLNKRGEIILKRIRAYPETPGAAKLRRAVQEQMPERNLLDILAFVEHWVHYTRHFGPLSGSDSKLSEPLARYIMTIFSYGCNLGPSQAARHSRGIFTPRMIAYINRYHVNANNLETVSRDIINFFVRFDLPHFWGTGEAAVADGTLFSTYLNTIMAARHIRYGAYGGIAYHHVSDNYIALFSHFIGVGVYEAVYIIDGLLKNTSDIQPDTLHADTHGQSLTVFGLTYLLGIKLMPRIRNWQDLNLYRPDKESRYENIDSLFDVPVDWELLHTHWKDMMLAVLSIRAGKLLPSMLLRKLGNFSRRNRLYRAFRELGRVIRSIFLLRYISDEVLRRQITSVTTIIESFNNLISWLFFGGHGIIQHNDPTEQEKRIKYNEVIANAVILMNVIDMTRILRKLNPQEYVITPQTLARLSPYMTEHIRRFGDYTIDLETVPEEPELNLPIPDFEANIDEENDGE